MPHLFRVWDSHREKRELILVKEDEQIYENLILKASAKLQKDGSTLVLEKDGSKVDDDEILVLLKEEVLLLLEKHEQWRSENDDTLSRGSTLSMDTIKSDMSFTSNNSLTQETPVVILQNNGMATYFDEGIEFESSNTLIDKTANDPKELPIENILASPSSPKALPTGPVNFEVWNNFEIPWQKLPSYVLDTLEDKKPLDNILEKQVTQIIVNEMRAITPFLSLTACRIIGSKIINKFPDSFQDRDKKGVTVGSGAHGIVSKLIDRNNYLNRPHKRPDELSLPKIPRKKIRQVVNSRAGCSNWQPISGTQNSISIQEFLKQEPLFNAEFWTKLEESYPHQRSFINNIESPPTIKDVRAEWPVLLTKEVILWHFTKVTRCDVTQVKADLVMKVGHILEYYDKAKKLYINGQEDLLCTLKIIANHFKEDMSTFFNVVGENDNAAPKTLSPSIQSGIDGEAKFRVLMENETILEEDDFDDAFISTFCLYFIFNLQYPAEVSAFLEFIQRYFFGLHPETGTRSKKNSSKNKVIALINKICK